MLPALVWNSESQQVEEPTGAWGELHLSKAAAYAGRAWTDDGALYEERALKHRPDGHTRTEPFSTWVELAVLEDVDGLGQVTGSVWAAT